MRQWLRGRILQVALSEYSQLWYQTYKPHPKVSVSANRTLLSTSYAKGEGVLYSFCSRYMLCISSASSSVGGRCERRFFEVAFLIRLYSTSTPLPLRENTFGTREYGVFFGSLDNQWINRHRSIINITHYMEFEGEGVGGDYFLVIGSRETIVKLAFNTKFRSGNVTRSNEISILLRPAHVVCPVIS